VTSFASFAQFFSLGFFSFAAPQDSVAALFGKVDVFFAGKTHLNFFFATCPTKKITLGSLLSFLQPPPPPPTTPFSFFEKHQACPFGALRFFFYPFISSGDV